MIKTLLKLPLVLVAMFATAMFILDISNIGIRINLEYMTAVSLGLFVFGLIIIAIGGYSFRKMNTTVNPVHPERATSLVTTGIYRLSRNPMYIGFMAWLLACTVFIGNIANLFLLPIFVILVNKLYIIPEENVLDRLFKTEFSEYKKKVRRWI